MSADIVSYKCPSCGAELTFNPTSQDFHCEYCGSHFTVDMLDTPLEGSTVQDSFEQDNRLYICPSCGASVITDSELDASAFCYYCHSPVVLSGRLSGEYRPDLIIPFSKTKEEALAGFAEWTNGRPFLAKGFGSPESLSKIQGIYIPFWLADCTVQGKKAAECFKTVSSVRQGDYIIKSEKKTLSERRGSVRFTRVPADGASFADDALMDSVEPFKYSDMVSFDMSYLSGHSAVRYDVTSEMVTVRIKSRVESETKTIFDESLDNGSRVNTLSEVYGMSDIEWKQAMLPIWFLSYSYKGKMYFYAMNGQTGKFGGTLPFDKAKAAICSFLTPLVAAFVIALLFTFFGGIV